MAYGNKSNDNQSNNNNRGVIMENEKQYFVIEQHKWSYPKEHFQYRIMKDKSFNLADATKVLNMRGLVAKTHITMEPADFGPWPNCEGELKKLQSEAYSSFLTLGRIDHNELNKRLKEYDIFVFPSMAETFGFPMLEAMRAGVPLIVSDIPIHREICGNAALYFELGDAEKLADKIVELNQSKDLRKQLN